MKMNKKELYDISQALKKLSDSLNQLDIELNDSSYNQPKNKSKNSSRIKLEELMASSIQEDEPWLKKAARITKRFQSTTKGHYKIYIILLQEKNKSTANALYVGMTGRTPEIRFQQHKQGIYKAARSIKKHIKKRLLQELYQHIHPMGEIEAKKLESEIAEALAEGLREAGIKVYGGH